MKIILILSTLLLSQSNWAVGDARNITPGEMTDLSSRVARELKSCEIKNLFVNPSEFRNKTDESFDKSEFIGILEKQLQSNKIVLGSPDSGVPIQVEVTSMAKQSKAQFQKTYYIKVKVEAKNGSCSAEAEITKSSTRTEPSPQK